MSVDLTTRYLGLTLNSPLVVSSCPLTDHLDALRRIEQAGAGAAVLPSLFEEQIAHDEAEVDRLHAYGAESFPEALNYFFDLDDYNTGPTSYLKKLEEAKRGVSIPLIGSLNGCSPGGWVKYARRMQDAGADALELNIYMMATDPLETSAVVEQRYADLLADVRAHVSVPLAVKIGPYFSSLPNFALRLVDAGASGLVLFNRFLHPDIDLETLQVVPRLELSTPYEVLLPLRWIAILRGHLDVSLAATSGVHSAEDALKLLLAGADVVMTASSLLRQGAEHLTTLREGIRQWMEEKEYASIRQMRGSMSQRNCPDPAAFERANYMKALISYSGPLI